MKQTDIFVILPAYNEGKYIDRVLKKLTRQTKNIIVVDDGSKDDTVAVAKRYTQHVLVHEINLGKGSSMKTGAEYAFNHVGAKAIVFMDSDDQHDVGEVTLFFKNLMKGHQFIMGIRNDAHMPFIRRFGNILTSVVIKLLYGTYIPDVPSGYKAMTKHAYGKLKWKAQRYEVESEIAVRAAKSKIAFTCIPITTIYHDFDKGMTAIDGFRMMVRIAIWRFQA